MAHLASGLQTRVLSVFKYRNCRNDNYLQYLLHDSDVVDKFSSSTKCAVLRL